MIEFIIIEDNLWYINKYKLLIDRIMMNYDIEYDYIIFDKCSKQILKLLKKESFKIYLINYKKSKQEDELIRYIRENKDDWQSLIVLFYISNIPKVMKENLFIMNAIDKTKKFENELLRSLQICLKNYDQRPNTLRYYYKKVFYQIDYKDIVYIEKEPENKRCIIKTINQDYYIQGTLNKIQTLLDNRFFKCNKSYIINKEQMRSYDKKTNIIKFRNGLEITSLARAKKRELINYLRCIN